MQPPQGGVVPPAGLPTNAGLQQLPPVALAALAQRFGGAANAPGPMPGANPGVAPPQMGAGQGMPQMQPQGAMGGMAPRPPMAGGAPPLGMQGGTIPAAQANAQTLARALGPRLPAAGMQR